MRRRMYLVALAVLVLAQVACAEFLCFPKSDSRGNLICPAGTTLSADTAGRPGCYK